MAHNDAQSDRPRGQTSAAPTYNTAFAIGAILNLGFVVIEVVCGFAAHSLALLSDAGHNLSDVLGLLIAWAAMRIGQSLPTKRRTYGLRRASILAALTNAIVLLIAVGAMTWEAVKRTAHPEVVATTTVMWVAAAGVAVNVISAMLFMAGRKRDLNIQGAFLHMAADAAVSLGVVVVGFAIRLTGWNWLDPVVSLAIVAAIVWSTWGLLRESINLALDAVPAGIDPLAVEQYLCGLSGVQAIHDLHIWGMSTTESAMTVHLVMPQPPPNDAFLHDLGRELHEHFGIGHVTIQIERGDGDARCRQAPSHVV